MKAEGPELCPNVAPATSAVAASDKNAGEMPTRGTWRFYQRVQIGW